MVKRKGSGSMIRWVTVHKEMYISEDDRFTIAERFPGKWRAVDWECKEAVYTHSVQEAKDWCDQQLGRTLT